MVNSSDSQASACEAFPERQRRLRPGQAPQDDITYRVVVRRMTVALAGLITDKRAAWP